MDGWLEELERVCGLLGDLHVELAGINTAEVEAAALIYLRSTASSHAGKDAEARHGAVDHARLRIETRGEIEQVRERQTFLLAAIRADA